MTKEVKEQLGYIDRIIERNKITLSLTDSDLIKSVLEVCYLQGRVDVREELNQIKKTKI